MHMAIFPRPAKPRILLADLQRLWRSSTTRYKLVFGALAVGVTSFIVTLFIVESNSIVPPDGPAIIYAADWPASRTDAEIRQQQWKDAAERREAMEARRREFKKIDDALTSYGF